MNESMCSKTVTYLYECMQIGLRGTCTIWYLFLSIPLVQVLLYILLYFCSFPFAILSCNKKKKNKTKKKGKLQKLLFLLDEIVKDKKWRENMKLLSFFPGISVKKTLHTVFRVFYFFELHSSTIIYIYIIYVCIIYKLTDIVLYFDGKNV